MRILLTGGGTGGHLFPIIAVAREIKKIAAQNQTSFPEKLEFMFLGPETIGQEILKEEGINYRNIFAGKMRRYASTMNFVDIFKVPIGICQSLWHLFFFMPNAVFSKGGFGSVPVVIVAWIYRIPILIHESDAIPGLANKICAKFSQRIAISYKDTEKYFPSIKTALTGNPVRENILGGSKEEAAKEFGLNAERKLIFVLGGSQGAKALNDVIFSALPALENRYEIILQCGAQNFESIKKEVKEKAALGKLFEGLHIFAFLDEKRLKLAYAAADLIISRAGAGTIAEISALGKASIIVPLPNSAADHQQKNAIEFSAFGACLIIEQVNLTPHLLASEISELLENPETLKKMGDNAKKFNPPDAAQKIAEETLKIAKI